MDGRKNNKGKKGNKGGPGRPNLVNEKIRAAVINKCWDQCWIWLDKSKEDKRFAQLTQEQEFDLIKTIVKSSIPKDININSSDINAFLNSLYAERKK